MKIIVIIAIFILSFSSYSVEAYRTQAIDNKWNICNEETKKQELKYFIPKNLLSAISLAESGRWQLDKQEISAWPWTVMSQGKGRFFETKKAAISWVHKLKKQGITNIDVGCMQVNLYHHGHQFPSLEHAFDPETNTTYAAKFLKKKYVATNSWEMAAAHYHSTNPVKNIPYKRKVLKFWNDLPKVQKKVIKPPAEEALNKTSRKKTRYESLRHRFRTFKAQQFFINHKHMEKLNINFRKKLNQFNVNNSKIKTESKRNYKVESFSKRRRAQISRWRNKKNWHSNFNGS